jgi:hypothetical protein
VLPGAGFDAVQTTLTAVKRKDPLVFLGSYTHSFNLATQHDGSSIVPGDANGLTLQTLLAVTPDVSLSSAFLVSFAGDSTVKGRKVEASGQTIGILQLGVSVALSDAVLLIATLGAGLTQATPDFLFGVAMPVRF